MWYDHGRFMRESSSGLKDRSLLIARPLESDLFGVKVFSATVNTLPQFEHVVGEWAPSASSLLVLRTPAESVAVVHAIESKGACLCDILVTLSQTATREKSVLKGRPADFVFRNGTESDAAKLYELALGSFQDFVGHWHADTRINKELADRLYAQWARDLAGRVSTENRLFVAEDSFGDLMGFIAFDRAIDKSGEVRWSIPLTAVASSYRGRGVFRAMLVEAMESISQDCSTNFDYETQLTNYPALRVVSRLGFLPSSSRLTFHLWQS